MLAAFDRRVADLGRPEIAVLALLGVVLIGALDFATGFELSFSVFYLGPVAFASWYGDRRVGVGAAILSCVVWYLVDRSGGAEYGHEVIPVWNALVRFGFFLTNALLLAALRVHLGAEERLARIDPLTGILNLRAFSERLELELAEGRRSGRPRTLAYVDLDDFKGVNDRLGHAGGNRVLAELGRRLRETVRETDAVARIGGDEFALLLPDTDLEGAKALLGKLFEELSERRDGEWGVAFSVGAVVLRGSPESAAEALRLADGLMFEVKRSGKHAVALAVLEPGAGDLARVDRHPLGRSSA